MALANALNTCRISELAVPKKRAGSRQEFQVAMLMASLRASKTD